MPKIVQIEARDATNMVQQISANLPKSIDRGLREFSKRAVFNLREAAKSGGRPIKQWGGGKEHSIFSGRGLFSRRVGRGRGIQYNVYMAQHGIYLDSMKPHWVSLKRGRDITKWALYHNIAFRLAGGEVMTKYGWHSIYVRPHPFIRRGYMKTLRDIKVVEKEINKTIRSKGRR